MIPKMALHHEYMTESLQGQLRYIEFVFPDDNNVIKKPQMYAALEQADVQIQFMYTTGSV